MESSGQMQLVLWIIATLLGMIFVFCGIIYRGIMTRMDSLERQHKTLCAVFLTSTIAMHPERAKELTEMMSALFMKDA